MKIYYNNEILGRSASDYAGWSSKPQINDAILETISKNTEEINVTWWGTQAAYDAIATKNPYTLYIIEDENVTVDIKDYETMANLPTLNGIALIDNITSDDIDTYLYNEVDEKLQTIQRYIKVAATKPAYPQKNTVYYIGPSADDSYEIWAYNNIGTESYMGTTLNYQYSFESGLVVDKADDNSVNVRRDNYTVRLNASNQLYVQTMAGCTASTDGMRGLVPAPSVGDENKFLSNRGTWEDIYDKIYPIGSVFISAYAPLKPKLGTWIKLSSDNCLWSTSEGSPIGSEELIEAGIPEMKFNKVPNHKHYRWDQTLETYSSITYWGTPIKHTHGWSASMSPKVDKDGSHLAFGHFEQSDQIAVYTDSCEAHTHEMLIGEVPGIPGLYYPDGSYIPKIISYTSIFGRSTTVRPPSIGVTIWQRIA